MVVESSESTESDPTASYRARHSIHSTESSSRILLTDENFADGLQNDLSSKSAIPPSTLSKNDNHTLASIEKKFIASLDVGTTIVRCFIFDQKAQLSAEAQEKIHLLHPKTGYVEMDPEELWNNCQQVLKRAVDCVGVSNICCLGLCTQRCSFLLWNANTGKPLHNIITWKDLRADKLVKEWNKSFLMKVSDQGASLAGGGSHTKGHVKITLGTGAFLNLNTGRHPHTSVKGIYPVVGWQCANGDTVFMAEGSAYDMGTVVEWGMRVGLYSCPSETVSLARSVSDCGGVYFVPAFHGLQAPVNDSSAGCGFIGVTPATGRGHLVRALLDSLAYIVYQLYEQMQREVDYDIVNIKADGGVSCNAAVLQEVATLTDRSVTRFTSTELSGLGAALIAGIGAGIYKDASDIVPLLEVEEVFRPAPAPERKRSLQHFRRWQKAVKHFTNWNK